MACMCCDPPRPCCGCWSYRMGTILASVWTLVWCFLLLAACIVTVVLWPISALQTLHEWTFVSICILLTLAALWLVTDLFMMIGICTKVTCLFFPWLLVTVAVSLMMFIVVFALIFPLGVGWYVGVILAVIFSIALAINIHAFVIVICYVRSIDTGDEELMGWHTWPRKKKMTVYTDTLQRADDKESIYVPSHYSYNTVGTTGRMLEEILYPANDPRVVYPTHMRNKGHITNLRGSHEILVAHSVIDDNTSSLPTSKRSGYRDVELVQASSTSPVSLYPAGSVAASLDREQDRSVLVARSVCDEPVGGMHVVRTDTPQGSGGYPPSGVYPPSSSRSFHLTPGSERDEVFFPHGHDPHLTRF